MTFILIKKKKQEVFFWDLQLLEKVRKSYWEN